MFSGELCGPFWNPKLLIDNLGIPRKSTQGCTRSQRVVLVIHLGGCSQLVVICWKRAYCIVPSSILFTCVGLCEWTLPVPQFCWENDHSSYIVRSSLLLTCVSLTCARLCVCDTYLSHNSADKMTRAVVSQVHYCSLVLALAVCDCVCDP